MPQGVLPFQFEQESASTNLTGLAGLALYLDLWSAMGLDEAVREELADNSTQGWPLSHLVRALVLLNISGGEGVSDLRVLRADAGLCRLVSAATKHRMTRRERRRFKNRFRKKGHDALPSDSAVHRFLSELHDEEQEALRQPHKAFIPAPSEMLSGLQAVNDALVAFVQRHHPIEEATLDGDATLTETQKSEALYSYKKFKAYQPLNFYWAEQGLVAYSQFRDGNVPAGYKKLDGLQQALRRLPAGVRRASFRGDSAAYEIKLLRYCAEGKDERFGVIKFAVSSDVTSEFKDAVAKVPAKDWRPLHREFDGTLEKTEQEWAEVPYVPNWAGYSKNSPTYRFIAIREPLKQLSLPTVVEQLPFPTMQFGEQSYKIFGVVTNSDLPGDELIRWHRKRCGKSEAIHDEMKHDLAGGRMPSGKFGANAGWWAIMVLALNLNTALKRLVLRGHWIGKRLKALRFAFINMPARLVEHARRVVLRIAHDHPSLQLLIEARGRILKLSQGPPIPT